MGTAQALRTAGILIVLIGWLVVFRGLYLLPVPPRQEFDLEAGSGFGVTMEVYVPALMITVLLMLILTVGAISHEVGLSVVRVGVMTLTFEFWTLTRSELLDYLPGLTTHLWLSIALHGTALSVVGLASAVAREGSPGAGLPPTSVR